MSSPWDRANALIAAFPRPAVARNRAHLVVMAGLPASGKSHFARALSARTSIAYLSADVIRRELFEAPTYEGDENHIVHTTVRNLAERLLAEGCHVLLDATNVVRRDRRRVLEIGSSRGAPTVLVWCEVDDRTAAARLAVRARGGDRDDASQADAAVRSRMLARTTAPTDDEAGLVVFVEPATEGKGLDRVARRLAN
jgi:predicted kinase